MPRLRSFRLLVGAALLAVGASADVRPVRAADDAWRLEQATLLPGVAVTAMLRAEPPLAVHAVRVSPDAPVDLRPVLASGAIGDETAGRGQETTSSMCDRAGAIVCVNADFNACPGCREPFGGVVRDGRVLRSFNVHHEQLSVGPRGLTTERVRWTGVVRASYVWQQRDDPATGLAVAPARSAVTTVELARLNVRLGGDEVAAYTSEWAPTAPAPAGAAHLSLLLSGPLVAGSLAVVGVEPINPSPIPADGVVIVASGTAADDLSRFWDEWVTSDADERALVIETATSEPLETSVGGHPVLLRGGQVLQLNQDDPKVRDRHPRTLAGWTAAGELLLLTVDGRQPGHSEGLTLVEAQQLLLSLGAVDGINLDGGGSSTFVAPCGAGRCVRNRPSDGRERRVTVALAIVAAPPVTPVLPDPPSLPAAAPPDWGPEPAAAAPAPAPAPVAVPPSPPSPAAPHSPAPPGSPPAATTPGTAVVPGASVGAAAPTRPEVATVPPGAPAGPVPRPGRPPTRAPVSLEVLALGLWVAIVAATLRHALPRHVAVATRVGRRAAGYSD